jgi:pimeloyl-ACP methyl ester carboxylesterase
VFVGLGSSKARNAEFVHDLAREAGLSTLVVDFSGHGDSPFPLDQLMPAQHILEAVTAFDWLQQQHPHLTINVMGASYGGFIAAWLSKFRDFNKLVLRTPALYQPADLYTACGNIDIAFTSGVYRKDEAGVRKHPIFSFPTKFTGETLVVVHGDDEDVPPATTDAYTDAFSAETYLAEGLRHSLRDPANPQSQLAAYRSFIAHWFE